MIQLTKLEIQASGFVSSLFLVADFEGLFLRVYLLRREPRSVLASDMPPAIMAEWFDENVEQFTTMGDQPYPGDWRQIVGHIRAGREIGGRHILLRR